MPRRSDCSTRSPARWLNSVARLRVTLFSFELSCSPANPASEKRPPPPEPPMMANASLISSPCLASQASGFSAVRY